MRKETVSDRWEREKENTGRVLTINPESNEITLSFVELILRHIVKLDSKKQLEM